MSFRRLLIVLLCANLCFVYSATCQANWNVADIPPSLIYRADAVIRECTETISLEAQNKVMEDVRKVVTVLNEEGLYHLTHIVSYKSSTEKVKIKQVLLYNAEGNQIKKLKKSEIEDVASYDHVSMVSDVRQKVIRYAPAKYPVTIEMSYTVQRKNSLHLAVFSPLQFYNVSVENYAFNFVNNSGIEVATKTYHLDSFSIKTVNEHAYIAKDIPAIKKEPMSPSFGSLAPKVYFRPTAFYYEGHSGDFESWEDYGQWINASFLEAENNLDPSDLPPELQVIYDVSLTDLDKVKLVYEYIQKNTRYILINLEDGGLKPMKSGDVNNLKYGDCKALSFYMYSILKSADIPIKYGIVYAGTEHQISMDQSFPNPFQANHIIVQVPLEKEKVWLDCTSSTNPFNFLGSFTDNRYVLLVDDEEITIEKTPTYGEALNKIEIVSEVDLDSKLISVKKRNSGLKMSTPRYISTKDHKTQKAYFNHAYFPDFRSYKVEDYNVKEDVDNLVFNETFALSSDFIQEHIGSYIQVRSSVISLEIPTFEKRKRRHFPIEITRTSMQQEELKYRVGASFELIDQDVEIIKESAFGKYTQTIEVKDDYFIIRKSLLVYKNNYEPSRYKDIRQFFKEVSNISTKKITIKKI